MNQNTTNREIWGLETRKKQIGESNQPGNHQKKLSKGKEDWFHSDWRTICRFHQRPQNKHVVCKVHKTSLALPFLPQTAYEWEKKPQKSDKRGCLKKLSKDQAPNPHSPQSHKKISFEKWVFSSRTQNPINWTSEFFRFQTPWRIMASLALSLLSHSTHKISRPKHKWVF